MANRQTVVRKRSKLSKPMVHALLMEGWSRAIAKFGKGAFADALEISSVGLDKQLVGSMPDFATILDALDHDETVLDDLLKAKGLRLVDAEAVCDSDDASVLIARLMVWLAEAQHPDSPGGRRIVHTELVGAEALIRQLRSVA